MTRSRDGRTPTVADDATPEAAAAIAAAVDTYRREMEGNATASETWDGERFRFAGRIEGLTGTPRRVPRGAPTDGWTAMGRLDRYHD